VDLNIEPLKDADLEWADWVLVSAMIVQKKSSVEVIAQAKAKGKIVIAGGPLFTMEKSEFDMVDHLILNEGEITLPRFLADFQAGKAERIYETEEFADISTTPTPMWNLVKLDKYNSMSVQYSRGCPFACDFCNVTSLLGHVMRLKTTEQFIRKLMICTKSAGAAIFLWWMITSLETKKR